jgi:hypothetical protein
MNKYTQRGLSPPLSTCSHSDRYSIQTEDGKILPYQYTAKSIPSISLVRDILPTCAPSIPAKCWTNILSILLSLWNSNNPIQFCSAHYKNSIKNDAELILRHIHKKIFSVFLSRFLRICNQSFEKMHPKKVIRKNMTEICTFFTLTYVRQTCFACNFFGAFFTTFSKKMSNSLYRSVHCIREHVVHVVHAKSGELDSSSARAAGAV